jgi:hypothetical protein
MTGVGIAAPRRPAVVTIWTGRKRQLLRIVRRRRLCSRWACGIAAVSPRISLRAASHIFAWLFRIGALLSAWIITLRNNKS